MTSTSDTFTPVIIIGAGRSGTNALRDALTRLPDMATWDCDEINPIWRHGNISWPNDEIPAAAATPKIRLFIQNAFSKLWRQSSKPTFVVEKTCANALRVPFIDAVLPNARFIHIIRDGGDVVASARKRWQGDLELPGLPYFLAKARYTPLVDLPIYGFSFLRSRIGLLLGKSKRLAVWGPRFEGIQNHADAPLEEICARQWVACVEKADAALGTLEPHRVHTVRYETFTQDPVKTLAGIRAFLDAPLNDAVLAPAAAPIRKTSVGKGKDLLDTLPQDTLNILKPTRARLGYDS